MGGVGAALARKYERMIELRAAAAGAGDAAALRAFAAEWPGALKELDTLATAEIERRRDACRAGADEPWMAWMARYHVLMRAALALRRGDASAAASTTADAGVDDAFARAVASPPHGRLNAVVFAQLAREFDRDAREIWDALFPPRGRARRDYRR